MDLTDAIRDYITSKTDALKEHTDEILRIDVELDKNTHHNKGDVFHVRMNVQIPHSLLHAEETKDDMYAAIDICRDEMARQLHKEKSKNQSKQRKSQKTRRSLKSILSFWK